MGAAPVAAIDPVSPRRDGVRAPSAIGLRILDALLDDLRAPVNRLSAATGLSPRTVRRHRQALVDSGVLVVSNHGDATQEPGLVYFSIHASLGPGGNAALVRAPGCEQVAVHHNPPGVFLVGAAPTYAAAHGVERRIRGIPGVERVHFAIPQGSAYSRERLRAWIRAEVARSRLS